MEPLTRRRLAKTGTLSAGIVLILALLAMINYFGWKYYKRFDWTGGRIYSLSEKSRQVVGQLHDDVDVVMLMSPAEAQQQRVYEPAHELLQRYAAASSHIHLRLVDPEKNPSLAQQLAQRYGVTTAGVVFATAKDRRVVDASELADYDYSGMQMGQAPEMTGFKGEEQFTGALLQLAEGRKPKVLFTTGHGERSLDDPGPRGISDARELLGRDNFEIEEWPSIGKPAVPDKTDLVVIAGPTGTFLPPEIAALTAYVMAGGRMLILLDPTLQGSTVVQTGLEGWLAGYGVKVDDDIVVDPANPMPFFGSETLFVRDYADHPITKALRSGKLSVIVSLARSVDKAAAPAAGANPATPATPATPTTVTELLHTSADGWGETDLAHLDQVAKDAKDVQAPVSLGVAVELKADTAASAAPAANNVAGKSARRGRLVVFGDSDFAGKQLVAANVGNSILLLNSLNWLVERENLLGIPPHKTEQVHLSMSQSELHWLYFLTLGLLPGLAAAAGIWVFFRRRR